MNQTIIEKFIKARVQATPLVAVETADQQQTIKDLTDAVVNDDKEHGGSVPSIVQWDYMEGLKGINEAGHNLIYQTVRLALPEVDPDEFDSTNPGIALRVTRKMREKGAVVFFCNMALLLRTNDTGEKTMLVQGISNMRDDLAKVGITAVFLGSSFQFPVELANDVYVLNEPLPDDEELRVFVTDATESALQVSEDFPVPCPEQMKNYVSTLRGLSTFAARNSVYLSLGKSGFDINVMRERKEEMVKQIAGLSVLRSSLTFKDIGGYDAAKDFCYGWATGPADINAIVWLDEFADAMAGTKGDLSGVSNELQGKLLTYMVEREVIGVLCVGAPGTGKSLVSKALGNETNRIALAMDIPGMKGGIVGESTQNMTNALKTLDAVSAGGRCFFIASCNTVETLSPQLRSRFIETFFFGFPTEDERKKIWEIQAAKYGVDAKDSERVNDNLWTGREIEKCCRVAWGMNTTLEKASRYVIPVAVSDRSEMEALMMRANGAYTDASTGGAYVYKPLMSNVSNNNNPAPERNIRLN